MFRPSPGVTDTAQRPAAWNNPGGPAFEGGIAQGGEYHQKGK